MSDVSEKLKPVTYTQLNLDSKALTVQVIANKRAREFTKVKIEDILDGRYEHITFLGKG